MYSIQYPHRFEERRIHIFLSRPVYIRCTSILIALCTYLVSPMTMDAIKWCCWCLMPLHGHTHTPLRYSMLWRRAMQTIFVHSRPPRSMSISLHWHRVRRVCRIVAQTKCKKINKFERRTHDPFVDSVVVKTTMREGRVHAQVIAISYLWPLFRHQFQNSVSAPSESQHHSYPVNGKRKVSDCSLVIFLSGRFAFRANDCALSIRVHVRDATRSRRRSKSRTKNRRKHEE